MKSTGWRILTIAIIVLVMGCTNIPQGTWPSDTWERSTPEAQGINSGRLLTMLKTINPEKMNIHSMVIIRDGRIVADFYRKPYEKDMLHLMYSSTKSFISTLIGIALDQRLIGSVEDSVFTYLPEYKSGDPLRPDISIEDLLTMRSGVYWSAEKLGASYDPTYQMFNRNDDWLGHFFALPMDSRPGELFDYNNGNTQVLAEILNRVTGGKARQFAEENLLTPLGITDYVWQEAPGGCIIGPTGLSLRTEDLARLGYLFLNKGYWKDRKLISPEWVKNAVQNHVDFSTMPSTANLYPYKGYGYQWWLLDDGMYATIGYGGQYCFVYPEKNLVIAMNASITSIQEPAILTLVGLGLQHAAESPEPLPEKPEAAETLYKYLACLTETNQPGPFVDIGIIDALAGRTISFTENSLGLKSLSFSEGEPRQLMCEMTMDEKSGFYYSKNEASLFTIRFAIGLDGEYRKSEVKFPGFFYTLANGKIPIHARAIKLSANTLSYNFTIPVVSHTNSTDTLTLKDGEVIFTRSNIGISGLQNAVARGVIE